MEHFSNINGTLLPSDITIYISNITSIKDNTYTETTQFDQESKFVNERNETLATTVSVFLHIDLLSLVIILIALTSFILSISWCWILRYLRRKRKRCFRRTDNETVTSKKGLLSLMFAKLDEFDSLTPLILSPASGVGSVVTFESSQASAPLARLSPTLMIDETSQTATSTSLLYKIKSPRSFNKLFGIASPVSRKSSSSNSNSKKEEFIEPEKVLQAMQAQFASQSSDSPPPPRRTSCGQTLIAPLTNFNKPVMARSQASNALTPDSRVTTFEYTTSKSCATIPEDDETEESLFCDDLISIDRTIISTLQAQNNTRYHGNYSNLSLYGTIPKHVENPTPPPSYVPAPPGTKTNDNSEASGNVYLNYKSRLNLAKLKSDSPTKKSGISNLSSPQSSIGSNSPVDTCSSESESSFIATKNEISLQHDGEEDQNEGGTGEDKYLLHRIDEVSERGESLMSASKTMDSIATISSYGGPCTNLINHYLEDQGMARSVSAQFELMNLQRKQS